jgi:hypothetical protein
MQKKSEAGPGERFESSMAIPAELETSAAETILGFTF